MRDLEFLPAWYPQLRRRKRLLLLQTWGSLALIGGLGLWIFLAARNARADEERLGALMDGLSRTESQLVQLDELLTLENQQRRQVQVLEKLGGHVEATRLVGRIEEAMPNEMALLSLTFAVEESTRPIAALAAASRSRAAGPALPLLERRARIKLVGVAPTDVDVAAFLARLSEVRFFEQVAMTYARDKAAAGHLMREFEVTFSLPLGAIE